MVPSKLISTLLLFPVEFPGILKGHEHLRGFSMTVVEQTRFPSWHISRSPFLSFFIAKNTSVQFFGKWPFIQCFQHDPPFWRPRL